MKKHSVSACRICFWAVILFFLAGFLLRLAVSLLLLNVSFYVLFFTGTFTVTRLPWRATEGLP